MTESEPLTASPSGERQCQCVRRHSPNPEELHRHHVWPLGEGGPDVSTNLLWLCPTTHSNVHKLWRLYEAYGGAPDYHVRRGYSIYTREVVERGWLQKMHGGKVPPPSVGQSWEDWKATHLGGETVPQMREHLGVPAPSYTEVKNKIDNIAEAGYTPESAEAAVFHNDLHLLKESHE